MKNISGKIFVVFPLLLFVVIISSCSLQKKIAKSANEDVLKAPSLINAHVGISIYEPATNKYWFNYQGDHFFVPASNTKLATCYAAMKYLGDSLVGLKWGAPDIPNDTIIVIPTGDPTFLHPDFPKQPVFDFLRTKVGKENKQIAVADLQDGIERWGNGWSWNDYQSSDMAERNAFPVFGNVLRIRVMPVKERLLYGDDFRFVTTGNKYFDSILHDHMRLMGDFIRLRRYEKFGVDFYREIASNDFVMNYGKKQNEEIPFVTHELGTVLDVLSDSLKKKFVYAYRDNKNDSSLYSLAIDSIHGLNFVQIHKWNKIYSQPTDSVLKPMMHRSDNFFAEQMLLMVSNEKLGLMNDEKIIDTLLKTDYKDLPQPPRWVDGCGLSRYNLFSPQDFVTILKKIKDEFGMARIKNILATGGEGTLLNYYKSDRGFIFAKTGTLSGVVALSGYLYTKKGKQLIFSVIVNNHHASATDVRKAVERFLESIREEH